MNESLLVAARQVELPRAGLSDRRAHRTLGEWAHPRAQHILDFVRAKDA